MPEKIQYMVLCSSYIGFDKIRITENLFIFEAMIVERKRM